MNGTGVGSTQRESVTTANANEEWYGRVLAAAEKLQTVLARLVQPAADPAQAGEVDGLARALNVIPVGPDDPGRYVDRDFCVTVLSLRFTDLQDIVEEIRMSASRGRRRERGLARHAAAAVRGGP